MDLKDNDTIIITGYTKDASIAAKEAVKLNSVHKVRKFSTDFGVTIGNYTFHLYRFTYKIVKQRSNINRRFYV